MNSLFKILCVFSFLRMVILTDPYLQQHSGINNMEEVGKVYQQKGEAFHRDGWGRNDPNQLLNGFFPVWAILLIGLAGFIIFLLCVLKN